MTTNEQLRQEILDIWETWNCEFMNPGEEVDKTLALIDREKQKAVDAFRAEMGCKKHGMAFTTCEVCLTQDE